MTQKINSFDKPTLRVINADIESVLQSVATKYGIRISVGNGNYNVAEYNVKVNMQIPGMANPNADMMGLPPNIVGTKLKMLGKNYEVIRVDTNKPKFPIIVQLVGGSAIYKISVEKFNQYNKK